MIRRPALLSLVLVAIVACTGSDRTPTDDPLPSALEGTASPSVAPGGSAEPPATAAPSAATETDEPPPAEVSQTDTEWGRIWDALPEGFPVYPSAVPSEEAGGGQAVSAVFTAPTDDALEIATWLQSELELATYSTEALSGPLEDGSFVIDSVGEPGCRVQTQITPTGGLTTISVLYGADCPIE